MTSVAAIIVVVAAHELAHALMALSLGLPIQLFFRFPVSAGIGVIAPAGGLRPAHDLAIALAGPVASLALVWPLWMWGLPIIAVVSGICGLVSLFPLRPQDGWRALEALRLLRGDLPAALGQAEAAPAKTVSVLPGRLVHLLGPVGSSVNTESGPSFQFGTSLTHTGGSFGSSLSSLSRNRYTRPIVARQSVPQTPQKRIVRRCGLNHATIDKTRMVERDAA